MVVKVVHLLNAEEPIDVIVPLAVTLFKLVQPLKILDGISVIEAGSSILVKEVQFENRLPSSTTSPSGKVIPARAVAVSYTHLSRYDRGGHHQTLQNV